MGSPKRGAQLCFAEGVDAIKMMAKTRSEHGVARPILCRKKTWNLLFFHWFFKLFSFQDDRKNSPNINPPAVVARSRLATIPPPDLPLGCKFILRSHPHHNVPRRDSSQRRFPSSASRSARCNRAPLPLQTSPYLKIFILRSQTQPQRPAPR